ncbi:hypothetical protein HDV00_005579 [Rhizophlyctis rosea]|nr:hypothetical protein HDV00_005579 [Rhizophlyctis rosea]
MTTFQNYPHTTILAPSSPHDPITACPPTPVFVDYGTEGCKSFKGLRDFSRMVADKVQLKGVTTYNEVAEELVEELAIQARERGIKFDQKNIRRRVYDALNVLMAMGIIIKSRKEIRWVGLPNQDARRREIESLKKRNAELRSLINRERKLRDEKMSRVRTDVDMMRAAQKLHNLAKFNISREGYTPVAMTRGSNASTPTGAAPEADEKIIYMPFIVMQCHRDTDIDINVDEDRNQCFLTFNDQFVVHKDVDLVDAVINGSAVNGGAKGIGGMVGSGNVGEIFPRDGLESPITAASTPKSKHATADRTSTPASNSNSSNPMSISVLTDTTPNQSPRLLSRSPASEVTIPSPALVSNKPASSAFLTVPQPATRGASSGGGSAEGVGSKSKGKGGDQISPSTNTDTGKVGPATPISDVKGKTVLGMDQSFELPVPLTTTRNPTLAPEFVPSRPGSPMSGHGGNLSGPPRDADPVYGFPPSYHTVGRQLGATVRDVVAVFFVRYGGVAWEFTVFDAVWELEG